MNNHTKSAIAVTVCIMSLISMLTTVEFAIDASPYMQDQLMLSGLASLVGAILSAVAFREYDRRIKAQESYRCEHSKRVFLETVIWMVYEQGRRDERAKLEKTETKPTP